jgi:hypothetical protein
MAAALAAIDRSAGGGTGRAAVPGDRLGDAMQQLRDAAAPLLQLLHPAMRDSMQGIGRTAEE